MINGLYNVVRMTCSTSASVLKGNFKLSFKKLSVKCYAIIKGD